MLRNSSRHLGTGRRRLGIGRRHLGISRRHLGIGSRHRCRPVPPAPAPTNSRALDKILSKNTTSSLTLANQSTYPIPPNIDSCLNPSHTVIIPPK